MNSPEKIVYARRSDIPPYDAVLTAVGQPLYTSVKGIKDQERLFCIVSLESGGCGILLSSDLVGREEEEQALLTRLVALLGEGNDTLSWVAHADGDILSTLARSSEQVLDEESHTEIMRDFDRLIGQALASGASDIHITDRKSGTRVEMRIHGYLEHVADWPPGKASTMANSVYRTFGEAKAAEFNLDMMATTNMERTVKHSSTQEKVRLRYTQTPVNPNEFYLNLRILKGMHFTKYTLDQALEMLGYLPVQIELIKEIIERPVGATIIGGETGSGKSTLIQALLECMYQDAGGKLNILTSEDPPEYQIVGSKQIPIDERSEGGIKFDQALALMLRLDGDVLMPGEIRDQSSINAVADGALSGHRVFATVHASSAVGIIKRIQNIGAKLPTNPIDKETMASTNFLSGLVHQSLLPKLCSNCAFDAGEALQRGLIKPSFVDWAYDQFGSKSDNVRFRNDQGCEQCSNRGLTGRTSCAEVLLPDETFLDLVREGRTKEAEDYWASTERGMSAVDVAKFKIGEGIVSPLDAANFVTGVLD